MKRRVHPTLAATALLALLYSTTGCATVGFWKWGLKAIDRTGSSSSSYYAPPSSTSSTSYQTSYGAGSYNNPSPSYSSSSNPGGGLALLLLLGSPVTLAFDAVTLPIQAYKGYGPFKKKGPRGATPGSTPEATPDR